MNNAAFSSFADVSAHLDALGLFHMQPGLARMQRIFARLRLARPPYRVVQVVGTNGKGSVSTMLASLAKDHGQRVGLHISPHFISVRERICIDGALLDQAQWVELGNELMALGGAELTYFEFVTALAVLAFARAGVDLAVMETGLGGSYDATTALEADMVVFTPIGLDHQAVLGDSLAAIAADKAGAIRPGKAVLSARQQPEVEEILLGAADQKGAPCVMLAQSTAMPVPGLAGVHQQNNAALALAAWRMLEHGSTKSNTQFAPASEKEAAALHKAWLPGRLHFIAPAGQGDPCASLTQQGADPFAACPLGRPPLLLDGAHNSHGLAALGFALAKMEVAPGAVVFSCLADKDLDALFPLVRSLATGPIFVPPIKDNPRAADPAYLARQLGVNARPCASLAEALREAACLMAARYPEAFTQTEPRNPLLVCGSLYMLGEVYALFPWMLERR